MSCESIGKCYKLRDMGKAYCIHFSAPWEQNVGRCPGFTAPKKTVQLMCCLTGKHNMDRNAPGAI